MGALVEIRAAVLEDAADMAALNMRLSVETKFMLLTPEEAAGLKDEQIKILTRAMQSQDEHILVASIDSKLVGFVAAFRRPFSRIRHCFSLVLGVEMASWGRHVGHSLLAQIETWVISNGGRRLELTVLSANTRAIRLYEHCGYSVEGIRRSSIEFEGALADEIAMAKLL